jgi:hypothetical protein
MKPRIAVFIDGQNVGAKHWDRISAQINRIGNVTSCRVYGDFVDQRMTRWLKKAESEALEPVMQLPGKNASDIAITVAAMDLLHSSRLEAVGIVSSDGDFTPLVHRLRSAGLKVFGFGDSKSPELLRRACNDFTDLSKPELVGKTG